MTRIPAALLAMALAASPAHSATSDARLKSVPFEADKVVSVEGRLGYQSMIEFGPGERIENVAVGDSAVWQVTPNKRANLLFLKPLTRSARTNMTVVTDQRVYLFDLGVAAAGRTPLYNLRFTYDVPQPPKEQRVSYPTLLADAPTALPTAVPAKLNFAWKGKGKKHLLPVRSFDNGHSLYLQWAPGTPLPALLARGPDGKEGPVNYYVSGPFIVIDQFPSTLVLRHGKKTATLTDRRPKAKPIRIAER